MAAYTETYIGLLVTGRGEQECLPSFFRSLCHFTSDAGDLSRIQFDVIGRIDQFSDKISPKLKTNEPTKEEEVGLLARRYLKKQHELQRNAFIIILDDLEWDRRDVFLTILNRYLSCFEVLPEADRWRGAAFFLVMMLEAYFWADIETTNRVLNITLPPAEGDPEAIRHPKNDLIDEIRKQSKNTRSYKEIDDSLSITRSINLMKVLSDPTTCTSLRTIVRWLALAARRPLSDSYQLLNGSYDLRFQEQLDRLLRGL